MQSSFNDFFNKNFTYAVVGASQDETKYGYKILKILLENGFKAIPVNPHATEILGEKCYPSLLEIPVKTDVVDFVVPPKVTREVLQNFRKKQIQKAWFQPGSFDKACLDFCEQNEIVYLKDFCLLESVLKEF